MKNKNIIITNEEKLEAIKKNIIADGPEKLQVVSDFDKTLTSCFVNGDKIVSLISILRDEHYLTPDYSQKAQALYDRYHPFEIDPNISLSEKNKLMREWWSLHYDLLIKSGLSKQDLKNVAESKKISFRPGALELFDFLNIHKIPLVILSAAGVGAETISLYLEKFNKLSENIHIVSNVFICNKDDKAIGIQEPIIHTFNKDYNAVKDFIFYKDLEPRKNIVLLGDSLSDSNMMTGFEYNNIIKIGFLNENEKGQLADFKNNYDIVILHDGPMAYILDSFKKAFDVIILNDGSMDYVNILIKELVAVK